MIDEAKHECIEVLLYTENYLYTFSIWSGRVKLLMEFASLEGLRPPSREAGWQIRLLTDSNMCAESLDLICLKCVLSELLIPQIFASLGVLLSTVLVDYIFL